MRLVATVVCCALGCSPRSAAPLPSEPGAPGGHGEATRRAPDAKQAVAARPAAGRLDCDKVLGAERASRALGRKVVQRTAAPAGAGQCVYGGQGQGQGQEQDGSALVDIVVACGEAAAPLARAVFSRIAGGYRQVPVGQKGVLVEEKGQGVVQFLEHDAPCAAEVTTVPADRAVAVAQEVERGLAGGGRP